MRSEVLVVWRHPWSGRRFPIGRLWREGGWHGFKYEREVPGSLDDAIKAGFWLLDEFPDPDGEWNRKDLFATFRRRLPQAWAQEEWAHLGVSQDDGIEYLRVTGGRLPTDTMEFLEPVRGGGAGTVSLRVPVQAWRGSEEEQLLKGLPPGIPVRLELEENRPYNACPMRVLGHSGERAGTVPSVWAWWLSDAVLNGRYRAATAGTAGSPPMLLVETDATASLVGGLLEVRAVPERLQAYAEVVLDGLFG